MHEVATPSPHDRTVDNVLDEAVEVLGLGEGMHARMHGLYP